MMKRSLLPLLLLLLITGKAVAETESSKDGPYMALEPFVVNIEDGRRHRFMQVKIQLEVNDSLVREALDKNRPAVRDGLLMLLSDQKASRMRNPEGREELRKEALITVRKVISQFIIGGPKPKEGEKKGKDSKDEKGGDNATAGKEKKQAKKKDKSGIAALYFTDFVIQ